MKPSLPLFLVAVILLLMSSSSLMAETPQATYHEPPSSGLQPNSGELAAPNSPEDVYNGRIRVYLVEPFSRWVDRFGAFYQNALLDFPIVEDLSLADGEVWYGSAEWDASAIGLGSFYDFNVRAIAALSNATSTVKDADDQGGGYYYAAHYVDACAEATPGVPGWHGSAPYYTHKVLAEECTATSCVYCPDARAALMAMAASGQFHMTHVALERDHNPVADAYVRAAYVTPTPVVFFDGGVESVMGGGTNMVPYYSPAVEAAGTRPVPAVELVTAIEWIGDYDAQIYAVRVHVAVGNNASANTAPGVPSIPTLFTGVEPGQSALLFSTATDPEANLLHYMWDYGDGETPVWEGPHPSGSESDVQHTWQDNGDYLVRVKVKDPFGEESDWSAPLAVKITCCQNRVGDANHVSGDAPTIGDVSVMIDALFISQNWDLIYCLQEADINQSGGPNPIADDITIGDISLLIDYLYITGESLGLANCF